MSDYVRLNADGLTELKKMESSSAKNDVIEWQMRRFSFCDDEEEDLDKEECRICHEEDFVMNLEAPCACNGSLKMAHRACVQRWCNEKRSTVCEICKQPYKDGYTISLFAPETILDINDTDGWEEILSRSRLYTAADVERLFGINPYEEYTIVDRVKAAIILGIIMFKFPFVILGLLTLIYVFTWIHNLSCGRRQTQEPVDSSDRLIAIPVGMVLPESMHHRRVVQHQSESDEDKDSVTEN